MLPAAHVPNLQSKQEIRAKRIRMARGGADMSRDELAARVSQITGQTISRDIIRRIETGLRPPTADELDAIAIVTGEPGWFVYGEPYDRTSLDSVIPGSLNSLSDVTADLRNSSTLSDLQNIDFRITEAGRIIVNGIGEERPPLFGIDPAHMRFRLFDEPIPYDRREQVA